MTANLKRIFAVSKQILEVVAALAVIGGVPLFLIQLRNAATAEQVASALQFAAIYDSETYVALRDKLEAPWSDVDADAIRKSNASAAVVAKLKLDIWNSSNLTKADLLRMTGFYNTVLACRAREICDPATIDLYFHDDIVGFYCSYDVPLADLSRSQNRPGILDDIRAYSGDCKYLR